MKESNFIITSELGKGSFGGVYECINKIDHKKYAMKIESTVQGQLKQEYEVYKAFKNVIYKDSVLWPQVYGFGHKKKSNKQVMIMDIYGDNLETIYIKNGNSFSNDTIKYLAKNMIYAIKVFHSKGFVHRDVKPQNFVVGVDNNENNIFLIDYGLAKKKESIVGYNRSLMGTLRYASINTHLGIEQSFRDDLYSVGYIVLYFALGKLPWQSCQKKDYNTIMIEKMLIKMEELVEGVNTPLKKPILHFLFYLLSLNFDDVPDYDYCMSLF